MDHERLDAYRVALEFVGWQRDLAGRLPKGHADLADQLMRAATSMVLNIAEGSGEFSRQDKVRFFRIARRSATECAAALDLIESLAPLRPELLGAGRALLGRVVAMLTRLITPGSTPTPGKV